MRIKNFDKFVSESYLPILEGGHVFNDTQKINKEDVEATTADIEKHLFPSLGLDFKKNVLKVGSAGHADVSGDIDFGISGIDFDELHSSMSSKFSKYKVNYLKGLEVLSIDWPIKGDKENGMVQVDFIPVYHKDWTKFVYTYPDGSKYKSAHRNWLLMSILSSIRENKKKNDDGEVVSYDGYMMNLNKGFFSIKKDYRGKTKLLKHAQIVEEKLITTDPDKFVKFVFGNEYKPDDVKTFEEGWHITIKSDFKWHSLIEDIKKNLKKFLDRVDLPIPKELGQ